MGVEVLGCGGLGVQGFTFLFQESRFQRLKGLGFRFSGFRALVDGVCKGHPFS